MFFKVFSALLLGVACIITGLSVAAWISKDRTERQEIRARYKASITRFKNSVTNYFKRLNGSPEEIPHAA